MIQLLLYAKWYMWEGGWCWSPRFLIPVLPLFLLPLLEALDRGAARNIHAAMIAMAVLSFAIAVSGIIVSYNTHSFWLTNLLEANREAYAEMGVDWYALFRNSWFYAPVCLYWRFPIKDAF